MVRTFTEAVEYVNLNTEIWERMLFRCREEWLKETNSTIQSHNHLNNFRKYLLDTYGIKHHGLDFDESNYYVIDEKKYLLFRILYA